MRKSEPWLFPAAAIAGLALSIALVVRASTGFAAFPSANVSLQVALFVVVVSAVFRLIAYIVQMWRCGIADPLPQLLKAVPAAARHQWVILQAVTIVAILLYSLTFLKSMLPTVVPFWADEPLAAFDRLIGFDGNSFAHAFRPYLSAIGTYYGLWHAINLGGILWVIHWRNAEKGQFILSYMLTWGIGMAAAYVFSSAGPLFTGRFDTSLLPGSVRMTAELLWSNYQAGGAILGGGISAFPSLHVAIATWFALALAQRGWPKIGVAYVASIYIGSVILGWHYLLDGAGGIAVAILAHRMATRILFTPLLPARSPALRP